MATLRKTLNYHGIRFAASCEFEATMHKWNESHPWGSTTALEAMQEVSDIEPESFFSEKDLEPIVSDFLAIRFTKLRPAQINRLTSRIVAKIETWLDRDPFSFANADEFEDAAN